MTDPKVVSEPSTCGRIMVGSGTDTYDPICELPDGHAGPCKSTSAVDQHRLIRRTRIEFEAAIIIEDAEIDAAGGLEQAVQNEIGPTGAMLVRVAHIAEAK